MLQAPSSLTNYALVSWGEAQSRRDTAKGKSGLEWGLWSYEVWMQQTQIL